jgi:hypothetical protein
MNTLLTLAHTNLADTNAAYNEATQIARAATMEVAGAPVLRDYYTFEEYIARRGNFIHRLPEYKHLQNACWVVRKDTADLIFDDEEQQLTVREVRRRELAREIEPLLPLPTTANTESIDGFRYCRPEGWGEWRADELGDGEERGEGEGDVQTSGESEAFYTPATSPVEGGLAVGTTSLASIAIPEAATSIADHAGLVEPLQQTATTPVRSIGSDGLDVTHSTHTDHSTSVPSITVTDDGQLAATRKETNLEAINRLKLSVDSLNAPTANGEQTGLNTFHNDTTISDPNIRTGVEAIDRLRLSIDSSLHAPTERGNLSETNTAHENTTIPDPKTLAGGEAQATPAVSLLEPSTTPAKSPKLDWRALSKGQPQPETVTTPPVEAPKPSPAKVKTFTPDPRVSSMAHYGIVAPIKKKDDTKHMEQSALKPATPVATTAAPTVPITAAPKPAPVPETSTTTAPNVPIEIAPPKPASLPETSIDAVTPAQKPDNPQQSTEPAAKRQKGIRGVAHPVKKTPARNKTPLTKDTPTPALPTDSPSTAAPTKLARRLASIIAGASLPKTKAEARAAATEHHARLLAQQNSQPSPQTDPNRRTSTRLLPKPTNPDLMPFFFSRPPPDTTTAATKTQGAAEQQDFIRCICGVQHDDGEPMICCETCEVWQHSACVVPGLAEGKLEALRWECTVCDPGGNREVLRGLRAGVKVKEAKEAKKAKGGKRRASAAP